MEPTSGCARRGSLLTLGEEDTMHPRNKAAVGLLVSGTPVLLVVGLLTNAHLFSWQVLTASLVVIAIAVSIGRSLLAPKSEGEIDADSADGKHAGVADTLRDKFVLWLVIAATMVVACWFALRMAK